MVVLELFGGLVLSSEGKEFFGMLLRQLSISSGALQIETEKEETD
jgi:hypothetical protein